jgi:flagellar secretion chaperone FliS
MNPYQKYRQLPTGPQTRMDALLALFDKALERLDKAEAALRAGDTATAVPQLSKTQLIVIALASHVRVEINPTVNMTVLRLYEFTVKYLATPSLEGIANARTALRTIRDGFERVRAEANELERSGRIPALRQLQMVHAVA